VAPKFVDVRLPPGASFREVVPRGHSAFAYLDEGDVRFGPEQTPARVPALVIFGDGDTVEASAGPRAGVGFSSLRHDRLASPSPAMGRS
jgi:redox-sensitive bicupin YhaK (pirin superfamily)